MSATARPGASARDTGPGPAEKRSAPPERALLDRGLAERLEAGERFFATEGPRLAELCHGMAGRFARGGRLIALGASAAARSDARHVAVEFVHPVIVGKRALPALAVTGEGEGLERHARLLVRPNDIVIAFAEAEDRAAIARAVGAARDAGGLTVAFFAAGADWEFPPPTENPRIRQELVETLYHVLWELVHVFFDHRGLLGDPDSPRAPAGPPRAAGFLYPFLEAQEDGLEAVLADVRRSIVMKSEEIGALRRQTLAENAATIAAAARVLRECFGSGGQLLALGNGGSATDAADVVADFRDSGPPPARAALDLTEDPGILTAIANDIGAEAIFARQVIAYGCPGDVLLCLSTSGGSANVLAALAEARRRGLGTIALVGYDGGRIAAEELADHVIVSRSEHIPRIQEAQASAYHLLRELVA